MSTGVDSEFVVTAIDEQDHDMTAHDHPGGAATLESAIGSKSGFDPATVTLHAVVRARTLGITGAREG